MASSEEYRHDEGNIRSRLLPPLSPESRPFLNEHARSSTELESANGIEAANRPLPVFRQIITAKVFAVMINFFISGLCTTGIGALISGIESFYDISDGPTAFIFPVGIAGYLCAASLLPNTLTRYGWRGVAIISPCLRLVSTIILSAGSPFAATLAGFFVLGFAMGLTDSGFCAWGSRVAFANVVQGMMHGSFSTGAVIGPILAMSVANRDSQWYSFYRVMIFLSCVEIMALGKAFYHDRTSTRDSDLGHASETPVSSIKHPLRSTAVWVCGIFYFFYIGVESSYSDWTIEYMKRVRHIEPTIASFSSSIFWIGMSCGRFALGPVSERYGPGRCVSTYITLSILCQAMFKLAQNPFLSLFLLGANGFFLGPTFPSGVVLLAKKVPAQSNIGAVAAAAAMGQVGGALAPLLIGFLADDFGIGRMLDVVLGLSFLLVSLWAAFCWLPTAH